MRFLRNSATLLFLTYSLFLHSASDSIFDHIDPSKIHANFLDSFMSYLESFPIDQYKTVFFRSRDKSSMDKFYIEKIPTDDFIKQIMSRRQVWEPGHASYIMKYARPGSIAIDVGAHIGIHTITMSRAVGPEGTVLALEPNQKRFRELVLNVAGLCQATNVHFYLQGAGAASESISNSFLNDNGPVDVITIDSLELSNVSLLKIDADGTPENSIIKGVEKTILKNKPVILLEIAGGINYEKASLEQKNAIDWTRNYVANLGYTLINMGALGQGCNWDFLCLPK